MLAVALLLFLVSFATTLIVVSLLSKYFKAKQKEQIRSMLRKAEEAPTRRGQSGATLLRANAESDAFSKLLSKFSFAEKLDLILLQAGDETGSTKLLLTCLIAGVVGAGIGYRFDVIVSQELTALCLGALAAMIPFWNLLRRRKKRLAQFEEQLPEALDFISRSMRAGHGFTIAMELLAADSPDPLGGAFRKIANDMQLGGSLQTGFAKLLDAFPLVDVRFFTSSVLLQQETGGNLGEILSKLSTIIRERFRLKGQVKAASAHGRITGLVLVLMPMAVAGFMMVTSPDYLIEMIHDKTGKMMVYGAVGGQIIGYFVIKKITNIKV